MSQVPGTVIEVNAENTQLVTPGQVIIKFDPADMNIALQHAQAALADTVREVRKDFENVERAEATLIMRKADLQKAQLDLQRRKLLIGPNAVSREEYQHYQTAVTTAQSNYRNALYSLRTAQALVENTYLYSHPRVEEAITNFKKAYLNLQRTLTVAPVTGYVAKRNIQVGQHVMLNTPMMAIIPLNDTWVDANYKETQLENLRIGQPVLLKADAYPDVVYHGKVFGLNAGTGSVFSLLPPQNATGNWIKIVQRLPVRIALDPSELKKHPLQLGLSMHVTVDIHNRQGPMLSQHAVRKPLYSTQVYARQLANANQWANKILQENSPNMYLARVALHE
jgi:membrane fusion protein (multidrug efflux system)